MRTLSALDSDKLGFALFLAVVLHGLLILGISFSQEPSKTPSRVLDVTLTRCPARLGRTQFDYLSEQNQHGKPLAEKPEEVAALTAVITARGEAIRAPSKLTPTRSSQCRRP